jgi:signal peptidase I
VIWDLSTLFLIGLAVTGAILVTDRLLSGRRRLRSDSGIVALARSLFPIILIVLLVRSFVVEPFRIPSGSMMPGLVDGDFIFVDKFSYGLRLPVMNTRIVPVGEPQRGDVVVFRLPKDPGVHYIKRLIGLPGDHVVVRNNRLMINGRAVLLTLDGVYRGGFGFAGSALGRESFGTRRHELMFAPDRVPKDFDAVVPAGQYFFMGDNRNDSEDSRFSAVGFVPAGNLVGRATRIWMNWRFPGWPDWRRIGTRIL